MQDVFPTKIEYRTPCRVSDLIKVQLWCAWYTAHFIWIALAVLSLLVFWQVDFSLTALLRNPGIIALPILGGLIGGFGFGPATIAIRWLLGKSPKQIQADISDDGIKILSERFNFEARWLSATWVKEGTSAYLLKFGKLMMRLPKRGFLSSQEEEFRQIIRAHVPAANARLTTEN